MDRPDRATMEAVAIYSAANRLIAQCGFCSAESVRAAIEWLRADADDDQDGVTRIMASALQAALDEEEDCLPAVLAVEPTSYGG